MVVPEVAADVVTVRTAITPFWMMLLFSPPGPSPVRKHVYEPELPTHERDLPAATAAAPALAEIATMSDGEYAKVHSMAAGWLPDGELIERLTETVPPGVITPDDRTTELD